MKFTLTGVGSIFLPLSEDEYKVGLGLKLNSSSAGLRMLLVAELGWWEQSTIELQTKVIRGYAKILQSR